MTESQDLPPGPRPTATEPGSPEQDLEQTGKLPSHEVEVDGHTFTLVEQPDGLSWDLFGEPSRGGVPAPRLAQITVSDQGYFSIDRTGEVRGPYPTLDEAAYPIGTADPALLSDPPPLSRQRTAVASGASGTSGSSSPAQRSGLSDGPVVSVRTLTTVLAAGGFIAALWLLLRQRPVASSRVFAARPVSAGRPARR